MTANTAPKVTLWEFFQQLGKTFMLPVALLSFCGIMLGIGSSLSSHDVTTLLPWLNQSSSVVPVIMMHSIASIRRLFREASVMNPAGSVASNPATPPAVINRPMSSGRQ